MGSGIHEFNFDDGDHAKWVREADGSIRYWCNSHWLFRLPPDRWRQLVEAMSTAPLTTDQLPIVGEIVGWRCWRWHSGHLWSLHQAQIWAPGEANQGHVGEDKGGIYAFKTKSRALTEGVNDTRQWPIVVGSVLLWGDAIEAANGWRAGYAKVRSLDKIFVSAAAALLGHGQAEEVVVKKAGWFREAVTTTQHRLFPEQMLADLRREYLGEESGTRGD